MAAVPRTRTSLVTMMTARILTFLLSSTWRAAQPLRLPLAPWLTQFRAFVGAVCSIADIASGTVDIDEVTSSKRGSKKKHSKRHRKESEGGESSTSG